jgi:hypothetical protein
VDQVGLNLLWNEKGLALYGSDDAKRITLEAFDQISRVANAESTQDVADGVLDLYLRIRKFDPNNPQATTGDNLDTKGTERDEPTGQPVRSSGDSEGPLSTGKMLRGMAKDAKGSGKQALDRIVSADTQAEADAAAAAQAQTGELPEMTDRDQLPYYGIGRGQHVRNDPDGAAKWERVSKQMKGQTNTLAGRLRAVLRHNAMDVYESGKRRGQLNTRKAYRAKAGNPRIFRQRHSIGSHDYTFGIIVDRSGSMGSGAGSNLGKAFEVAVMISEALEKVDLPCFIIPWDDGPNHVKRAKQRLGPHKQMLGGLFNSGGGGTYEAPALVIAQEEFAKITSGHRLMFTITDGGTNSPEESKQLIDELHEMGVRTVAIGINFQPARHYRDTLRVSNASELATILPRFINQMVRRGS